MPYRLLLLTGLALVPLLPLFGADEADQRRRLARMKAADPAHRARLRQEALAFRALPPRAQQQLVKLDHDLRGESALGQKRLVEVMHRYADWLEKLPEAQRRLVLETKDREQRLRLVRQLREQQWLESQPRAVQARVAALGQLHAFPQMAAARTIGQGAAGRSAAPLAALSSLLLASTEPAADYTARLRLDARKRQQDWLIHGRHWDELVVPQVPPTRPASFGPEVDRYVNNYLRHLLSKEELKRLEAAAIDKDKHWPQYACVLVELADRHPLALPGPQGIDNVPKLPLEVKEKLALALGVSKLGIKQVDKQLHSRFKAYEGKWPQFGNAVAEFAAQKKLTLPAELWPTRQADLSTRMQLFVEKLTERFLTREERAELRAAEQRWPDYPLKIQELANRYHQEVPWQTLPGPRERWDRYAVRKPALVDGYPPVPLPVLRDFALHELTSEERAALRPTGDEPVPVLRDFALHELTSEERAALKSSRGEGAGLKSARADLLSLELLTAKFFEARPEERARLLQADRRHKSAPAGYRQPYLGPASRGSF